MLSRARGHPTLAPGRYAEVSDYERAFDDASVLVRMAPIITQMGNHDELAGHLKLRISHARELGRWDCAIGDAKVWLDLEGHVSEASLRAALIDFQEASVMKLAMAAVAESPVRRPRFETEKDRRAFQKSARIGPWAKRRFGCVKCGAAEGRAGPLQWCSGCHEVCYCCPEHQRQHWKSHKAACLLKQQSRNNPYAMLRGTRREVLAQVREKGHVLLGQEENPDVLLYDAGADELYELISNQTVICEDQLARDASGRLGVRGTDHAVCPGGNY